MNEPKTYAFAISTSGAAMSTYRGRACTADIESLFGDFDRVLATHPEPLVAMTVIEKNATLGDRGRRRLAQRMREKNNGVVAWAIVVEKSGLWGTATRTIIATVRLMSKSTYAFKVFPTVEEGVVWLQTHSPVSLHTMTTEMGTLRATLTPAT